MWDCGSPGSGSNPDRGPFVESGFVSRIKFANFMSVWNHERSEGFRTETRSRLSQIKKLDVDYVLAVLHDLYAVEPYVDAGEYHV